MTIEHKFKYNYTLTSSISTNLYSDDFSISLNYFYYHTKPFYGLNNFTLYKKKHQLYGFQIQNSFALFQLENRTIRQRWNYIRSLIKIQFVYNSFNTFGLRYRSRNRKHWREINKREQQKKKRKKVNPAKNPEFSSNNPNTLQVFSPATLSFVGNNKIKKTRYVKFTKKARS